MPRDALTLADVRAPTLTLVREPCGRPGRYNVQRLIAAQGADMRLPQIKAILADCERARSLSICDRCKAEYEGL